ncbi:hypothetical protein [Desulfosporosinus sp. OT]|uniref:hypothetical protein n=1 Tax=Desulfosporosinus sp. OT TaxID=913865 RepID=UPI000223A80D|nr:hypothetical protein [Desulfosporosinus sp. OT]EGW36356.1 hypothetical protein DOT_5760 [Desulfosporosinus sp. OT]
MKKKSIIPVIAAGALAITMAAAATPALATASILPVAVKSPVTTSAGSLQPGNIEYAKKTLMNPDGSVAAVDETWADPATQAEKVSYSEPDKGTGELKFVAGAYTLENGSHYIKVTSDDQGNLTGYEIKSSKYNMAHAIKGTKQDYISTYQEGTRAAGWQDEGRIQTAEGKELNKLSRTDISFMPGKEGTAYTENVYLDPSSGLPVKGDISVAQNGAAKLLYTYSYEYRKVSDDGSIFSTQGISLEPMK